jgi:uncharacterized protein (TIGR02145 family)
MTQNLDFDINSNTTLDSTTTDLNVIYSSSTEQYAEYNDGYTENNDIIYWQPASSATTINFQNTGPITGWQNSDTTPYTANKTDSTETGHDSLGNYYNWSAAIASNNSSSLTQNTLSDISKNPQNSICPKGWRLPTVSNSSVSSIGSTNEFARLNFLYNNNLTNTDIGLISPPLFLTKSGYAYGGPIFINEGRLWSSTVVATNAAYHLMFTDTQVEYARVGSGSVRSYGVAIRCVAR